MGIKKKNLGVGKFIIKYAPTQCWCTSFDLYIMAEWNKFPDLEEDSFKVTLSRLKKAGFFEVKKDNGKFARTRDRGPNIDLYLRKAS